jgi:hypothetical protein
MSEIVVKIKKINFEEEKGEEYDDNKYVVNKK